MRAEGLVNARDLGGLRRFDSTETPMGVFYRSENVDAVTPAGWDQLRAAGIRTVVDLRQPGERSRDVSERPAWLATVAVDLDGLDNRDFWEHYWANGLVGTALYFLPHLEAMPERTVAALSAIVDAPAGGVLFHCMAGRDRTGMIAMLLLVAARARVDDIVDDYLESVRVAGRRAAAAGREDPELALDALCQAHGTTTEGAFRAAVAALDLEGVLSAGGMRPTTRHTLATWRGHLADPTAHGPPQPGIGRRTPSSGLVRTPGPGVPRSSMQPHARCIHTHPSTSTFIES
jgi:hypothetical protein